MTSKTPKFDAALDAILGNLSPHERMCKWADLSPYCTKEFSITPEDIKFYKKLRVPPPTLCPTCRRMRRLAASFLLRFYKTKCVAPGHIESTISIIPPDSPFKIYDWEYYRTYEWDPFSFGISPDSSRSFFDLFWDFRKEVPQPAIVRDPANIDSDYTMLGRNLKRGYFVAAGWNSERVYYSTSIFKHSEDIMDSNMVTTGSHCYEANFSRDIQNTDFIYFSNDCYSCRFMYDSKNCHDCFGCVNLRNRSYCFFNEQLAKDEYEKRVASLNLGKRSELLKIKERFWDLVKKEPIRALRNENAINSVGSFIVNSKNCYEVYGAEHCENIRYADITVGNKDSMDYAVSGGSELLYETVGIGSQASNVKFSFGSKFITDSEFLINCKLSNNCFACIGLENQSYCILNRKYEPAEYFRIVDEIKTAMLERGEYGEFFPLKFSSYAYRDSTAGMVFPLTKEEMNSLGITIFKEGDEDIPHDGPALLKGAEIPDDIRDVTDSILEKTLICSLTQRPFRIIADELEFYRRKQLPLPTIHPNERIKQRYLLANPYRLYDEKCDKCGKKTKSMYKKSDGFHPYCEDCYRGEVV